MTKNFILASGSPQRKQLLEQIAFVPKLIDPADIDETPKKGEKAAAYVKRMALEKAQHVAEKHPQEIVLAADTIVVVGTHLIHKSKNDEEQTKVMQMLSGKSHRVLTAVCVMAPNKKPALKLSETKIMMKNLSPTEIADYVATKEWVGCCGYKVEGVLAGLVRKMIGSYSGVVGLPLYETRNMLISAGVKEEK